MQNPLPVPPKTACPSSYTSTRSYENPQCLSPGLQCLTAVHEGPQYLPPEHEDLQYRAPAHEGLQYLPSGYEGLQYHASAYGAECADDTFKSVQPARPSRAVLAGMAELGNGPASPGAPRVRRCGGPRRRTVWWILAIVGLVIVATGSAVGATLGSKRRTHHSSPAAASSVTSNIDANATDPEATDRDTQIAEGTAVAAAANGTDVRVYYQSSGGRICTATHTLEDSVGSGHPYFTLNSSVSTVLPWMDAKNSTPLAVATYSPEGLQSADEVYPAQSVFYLDTSNRIRVATDLTDRGSVLQSASGGTLALQVHDSSQLAVSKGANGQLRLLYQHKDTTIRSIFSDGAGWSTGDTLSIGAPGTKISITSWVPASDAPDAGAYYAQENYTLVEYLFHQDNSSGFVLGSLGASYNLSLRSNTAVGIAATSLTQPLNTTLQYRVAVYFDVQAKALAQYNAEGSDPRIYPATKRSELLSTQESSSLAVVGLQHQPLSYARYYGIWESSGNIIAHWLFDHGVKKYRDFVPGDGISG